MNLLPIAFLQYAPLGHYKIDFSLDSQAILKPFGNVFCSQRNGGNENFKSNDYIIGLKY